MIKIVAKMPVAASKVADFKAAARELVEKSRLESGNVFYTMNVSHNNPNLFAVIECWKDQAAVDFHGATPHFTDILPKLAEMCDGDISIELFDEIEL
ncbi:MAG: antibiotic biosynthesis monooxygenase [Neisseriaceae bacterium]|nr:antibiotic biosynthesis monooxygenase [Neisseriaceae bacterium]